MDWLVQPDFVSVRMAWEILADSESVSRQLSEPFKFLYYAKLGVTIVNHRCKLFEFINYSFNYYYLIPHKLLQT